MNGKNKSPCPNHNPQSTVWGAHAARVLFPAASPEISDSLNALSKIHWAFGEAAECCTRAACAPRKSDCFEGDLQIVDQIADVLDSDRQPDERIGDAEFLPLFFWNGGMRHKRRMIDEAFYAAQALR